MKTNENLLYKVKYYELNSSLLSEIENTREIETNFVDEYGCNLLFYACLRNNSKLVKILLDKGFDPNYRNKYNNIALFLALANNNINTLNESTRILELFLEFGLNLELDINGVSVKEIISYFNNETYDETVDCYINGKDMVKFEWYGHQTKIINHY